MDTTATPRFDAVQYKETTRQQWQVAAQAWNEWGPFLGEWLGDATESMLDMAGVRAGGRVLDVAAGAGGQTIHIAERVGELGYVLATDISSEIIALADENARKAGYRNVETKALDGEALDVPEAYFDAVISRVGLIYFPDQQTALKGMLRALKPGGKMGAIVYSTPENNRFFSIPVATIRSRANLPPPLPGQPGPFSLGAPGVLEAALTQAGFRDVQCTRINAPLRMPSAAECVRFEKESFGALHQMLKGLDADARESVWEEISDKLRQFEQDEGYVGPCELVVGVGTK